MTTSFANSPILSTLSPRIHASYFRAHMLQTVQQNGLAVFTDWDGGILC